MHSAVDPKIFMEAELHEGISLEPCSTPTRKLQSVGTQTSSLEPLSQQSIGTQTDFHLFESSSQTPLQLEFNLPASSFEKSLISSTPVKCPISDTGTSPQPQPNLSSSYVLSTSTSESESLSSEDADVPKIGKSNAMYVVFGDQLAKLFVRCLYDHECMAPTASISHTFNGSMIIITSTCCNNHEFIWRSQPLIKKFPLGNILISAATLFTGNTFHTISEIAEVCSMKLFSKPTFHRIQNQLLFPTIGDMYATHLKEILTGEF